ncbi:MAG TPA: glycosyltransferase [Terriglobales bacterium]|jgi:spore maturation protein CgeB
MIGKIQFRIFAHSWISDWNHGNAHFLRGLAQELVQLGHEVRCYEESSSWSLTNLLQETGEPRETVLRRFRQSFPALDVRFYVDDHTFPRFAEQELKEADVVIIHEWNSLEIVNAILSLKSRFGFRALFHDTHHRAYTRPEEIQRYPLQAFDGVLAFGEAIRQIYEQVYKVHPTWTLHEAADTVHFQPLAREKDMDVVWIGNWGDEERTRELEEFLLGPAQRLRGRKIVAYGVRYPDDAKPRLEQANIEYRGYLPNLTTPEAYARSALSLHVPRTFYANGLSGIPTIRVFEALACGSPLICAPWSDAEGLFRQGEDYVCAEDSSAMESEIRHLLTDDLARRQISRNAIDTIMSRHTCRHRAMELVEICEQLSQ